MIACGFQSPAVEKESPIYCVPTTGKIASAEERVYHFGEK